WARCVAIDAPPARSCGCRSPRRHCQVRRSCARAGAPPRQRRGNCFACRPRWTLRRLLFVIAAALIAGGFAGARIARALPGDNRFVLQEHDRIVAEAPGCYASCQAFGRLRTCTIREPDCRAACITLPEC